MSKQPAGSAGGPPATRARGWHDRGYLPHCDADGVVQMVTYRLADSLPQELSPDPGNGEVRRRRTDALLDRGFGSCLLRRPEIAELIIGNWLRFDGDRYRLWAWVVMPNHVHLVLEIPPNASLSPIVHSWKSYTAHRIRQLVGGTGRLWQPDYYDRFIRDDAHFLAAVDYVEHNPVKAGLVTSPKEWPFSTAYDSHNSSSPKAMR